jgi:hypothetical protein
LNGWNEEKQELCGQTCKVIKIFEDKTFTGAFESGEEFDFPYTSV